jgi:hypothetical protein
VEVLAFSAEFGRVKDLKLDTRFESVDRRFELQTKFTAYCMVLMSFEAVAFVIAIAWLMKTWAR